MFVCAIYCSLGASMAERREDRIASLVRGYLEEWVGANSMAQRDAEGHRITFSFHPDADLQCGMQI